MQALTRRALTVAWLTAQAMVAAAQPAAPPTRADQIVVFRDEPSFTAAVSADGRLAALFTPRSGTGTAQTRAVLEIRHLQTGERFTLDGGESHAGTPGLPAAVFSPDARLLAYTWLDSRLTDTGQLQLIATERGARPRTLIPADPSDIGIIPHGWSPDGKRILVLIHGASVSMDRDPTSLAWVNVADGTRHTFKTLEPWRDGSSALPRLSPDGRWIAYSARRRPDSTDRAIHVVDAESGRERVVTTVGGSSSTPVWSPDSRYVVFLNQQHGSMTKDLLAFDVGRGDASPLSLEKAFVGAPIAISHSGTLHSMEFDWGWKGVVVPLAARGRVIETFSGHGAAWVEGKRVVFGRDGADIIVRTLGSGVERSYRREAVGAVAPRVFADGGAAVVFVPAYGDGGRKTGGGFYRVDFGSGEFTRLFSRIDGERVRSTVSGLSPDGTTLFLGVTSPSTGTGIVAIALNTGTERQVVPIPAGVAAIVGIAVSPDARMLALHTSDGRIFTAATEGGGLQEIVGPTPGGGWNDVVQWSRDGRHIMYGTRTSATSTDWRVMRVRSSGGDVEPVGVESSILPRPGRLVHFEFSPDSEKVALSVQQQPRFDVTATVNLTRRLRGGD